MSYKSTVRACYIGTVCQAIIINLTAILFIPLGEQFGLSYTQLGALVMVNFIIQVTTSLAFGSIVDRFGFKQFIVVAHILAVVGMALFAATPIIPLPPYIILMSGTVIFACAGGLLELLLSPILNAIPTPEKSSAMSIMHAFFCFGHLTVAVVTTLFIFIFGREMWSFVVLVWLSVPLVNIYFFAKCPIANPPAASSQSGAKNIFKKPLFFIFIFMILFAGASEITFSAWTSAYLEQIIGLPKIVGDIAGVSMFAAMMGASRIGYGILKKRNTIWLPSQSTLMLLGAALALGCYFLLGATSNPILALLACALCGFGVGLLWPGTLSLMVDAFPMAGTWIFAVMAAAGNIGSASGPSIFGVVADTAGLRPGFFVTAIFPIGAVACVTIYKHLAKNTL